MHKRILVVDDDSMNLMRTKMILGKEYDVLFANSGIEALENYFRAIGMPVSLQALGCTIGEAEIAILADKASRQGTLTLGNFKVLRQADMAEIYRMAN